MKNAAQHILITCNTYRLTRQNERTTCTRQALKSIVIRLKVELQRCINIFHAFMQLKHHDLGFTAFTLVLHGVH